MKQPTPKNSLLTEQSKDNSNLPQMNVVYEYLRKNTVTASMVEQATGIKQKSICRYKRKLEKSGRLWQVRKAHCKITGFKAWYLTTDPNQAPISNQLKLF